MIKHTYFSPKAEELLLAGNASICEESGMGTDDIVIADPIDWDWDNDTVDA